MCNDRPTLQEALHSAQAARAVSSGGVQQQQAGYLNQSSYTFRVPGASGSNSYLNQQQPPTFSGHSQLSGLSQEVVSVKPHSGFQSQVEQQLLQAKQPLEHLNSAEIVQAGPFRGTLLNKQEIESWRGGPVPLDQYRLNDDPNPEVVKKRMDKVKYTQELGVRYLNPPPAPKPGDLIIRERQTSLPPAPPLIIRQEG
jgi:hypothetical protein